MQLFLCMVYFKIYYLNISVTFCDCAHCYWQLFISN